MHTNIAIFASGGGSNARKIIEHFQHSEVARVVLVVSNKRNAGVLAIAGEYGIPTEIIDRQGFYEGDGILDVLSKYGVGFIALAGFLWLVPAYLVQAYPRRIVNIHPALLPKFGGKGMYGHHVHEAVKASGERESGPTIHWVNEHYDEGDILFQARCPIAPDDAPDDIARKVLELEHLYYPLVIEQAIAASMQGSKPVWSLIWVVLGFLLPFSVGAQPVSNLLKNAEQAARSGQVLAAAELWERAGRLKNADPVLLHRAAEAYAEVRDYHRASNAYRVAMSDKRFPLAGFKYARSLKQQARYGEAIPAFESFLEQYRGDQKALTFAVGENEIAGCLLARSLASGLATIVHLSDSINTREHEFAAIPFSDNLLYHSRSAKDRSVLLRALRKNAEWGRAVEAGGLPAAVSANFMNGCFSRDGSRFFYANCAEGSPVAGGSSVRKKDCALYCLQRTDEGWQQPERLPAYINLEGSTAMFPQVAQGNGQEYLFFSSDRAGGLGGLDIYWCQRPLDSEALDFSFPQNLGIGINTGADELTPFYDADAETLWFSSMGHPSLGGYDVFKTERVGSRWTKPENAGIPINSPADDYFFVLKKTGEGAFLSSNRRLESKKNETTDDDLFEIIFTDH